MPDYTHHIEVRAPIAAAWRYVKDVDQWATLVPGYVRHERVNDNEFLWTVKGNLGSLSKAVTFRVNVVEWVEPSRVAFLLKGVSENVTGAGHFAAEPLGVHATRLTGYLDLRPGGPMGPLVSAMMKPLMPKVGADFAKALAEKIEGAGR